jgi:3,4-dihydroxy-2-butanone 4-phosphate synthase
MIAQTETQEVDDDEKTQNQEHVASVMENLHGSICLLHYAAEDLTVDFVENESPANKVIERILNCLAEAEILAEDLAGELNEGQDGERTAQDLSTSVPRSDLQAVVDYLVDDERRNYNETSEAERPGHIFEHVAQLNGCLA